jgi:signal transduction histidine kinase/ActR/RegA family two-component response regulator
MPETRALDARRPSDTAARGIAVALLASAIACAARWVLDPWLGHDHPFLPAYAAVAVATLFGTWRSAALTAILCTLWANFLFVEPRYSFDMRRENIVATAAFYLVSAVIIYLGHRASGANKALARMVVRLAEADHRKSDFLALIAHELRNPLSTLTVGHSLIKEGTLGPASLDQTWRMLERQTDNMTRLVGDLLDVARIEQGKIMLCLGPVPVATIVNDAIAAARSATASKRQTLTVDMPAAPGAVIGDPLRLGQVLGNLLHNASKFSPDGAVVMVKVEAGPGHVTVSVKDAGIGIPSSELLKIFESFVQLSPRTDGPQGLGLGLALTKKLVEMHGGTVEARSDGPGKGAEFIVRLPRGAVQDLPAPTRPSPLPAEGAVTAPIPVRIETSAVVAPKAPIDPCEATGHACAALRLLVVDDNQDAAESLATLLNLKGHDVKTAHDGKAALRAVAEQQPQLVFLDIGLPDMTGYEVALQLRRQVQGAQPVLVALTGWGDEDALRRSRDSGFDLHLTKPVSIESIDEALGKTAGGAKPPSVDVARRNASVPALN